MRRDRNILNSAGTFSLGYNLPYYFLTTAQRRIYMGELSPETKTRLAYLEFYKQVREVSVVCRAFGISRQTFYKWQKRFNPCDLSSLENQPKIPKSKREGKLSFEKQQDLKEFREKYIRQSKIKLSIMYEKECGEKISSWQFQKVIEKYKLYYDQIKAERIRTKKKRNQLVRKTRINEVNPKDYIAKDKPFFFCVDGITLYLPFGKRYILTAIDHFNKLTNWVLQEAIPLNHLSLLLIFS